MFDLVRPPAHRGPLIAAGAVLLAVGIVLVEIRLDDKLGAGWHFAICAAAAGLFLAIAMQWPTEGGHAFASQSTLLVAGLLLLPVALLNLADVLGVDGAPGAGTLTWVLLVQAAVSAVAAARKASAICALIAAVAFAGAVLAAWEWIFDPASVTPFRWLLLVLAVLYVFVSLLLRGGWPRHAIQLVNAAGLAILGIAGTAAAFALFGFGAFFGDPENLLPGFWELVLLLGGCGLIAYAAADREPGPGYLGVANLVAFVAVISVFAEDTLEWWPFTLLVLGFVAFAAGLRPRRPLPPEPEAYTAGAAPLAARADAETVVNVRHQ